MTAEQIAAAIAEEVRDNLATAIVDEVRAERKRCLALVHKAFNGMCLSMSIHARIDELRRQIDEGNRQTH